MANILKLLFSIAVCLIVRVAGSLFTKNSIETWYAYLKKPFFNPPSWVFGLRNFEILAVFRCIKDKGAQIPRGNSSLIPKIP
jgi:tryptophan-rich sensory protein